MPSYTIPECEITRPDISYSLIRVQCIFGILTKVVRKVKNVLPYKDIYWL